MASDRRGSCGFLRSAGFRRAVLAVAGLAVGLGMYSANARWLVNDQMPMPLGFGVAVVMSGSMEPALHVDDLVVAVEPDGVEVGDVVVRQDAGGLVVHRVVEVGDGEVVTRGDANNADDAAVPVEAVKGVVALSVPGVGAAVRALRSPVGPLVVVAVAVALVEASFRSGGRDGADEVDDLRREVEELRAQASSSAALARGGAMESPPTDGVGTEVEAEGRSRADG